MFSRDFGRGPIWPVDPTVDLALNFHKKMPLYCPSITVLLHCAMTLQNLCSFLQLYAVLRIVAVLKFLFQIK